MTELECDVAIIGAGTAGISAERAARAAGAKTLLIDDRFAGTTCATVGCMPSKLLIAAAEAAHGVEQGRIFGVHAAGVSIDGPAVMRRVQAERDRFAAGARESFQKLPQGVCVQARARFKDATHLLLEDGRQISARAIVIATGSKSTVPKNFEAVKAAILTNETIFELKDLPKSLAVIGAGPLGLELAQAFKRLGVDVRVFAQDAQLTGIPDPDVASAYRDILGNELPITMGVKLEARPADAGALIRWAGATQGEQVFERVLIAAGRPPQLADLELKATAIELNSHGVPLHDSATLQCGDSSIFLAGDADHDRPVLHEAAAQGAIAGRNAARYPKVSPAQRYAPFSMSFTDPQLAIVGAVPKPGADGVVIGKACYAEQGRARVFGRNAGVAHLYAVRKEGHLIAAVMCGPAVEHSAHLLAWVIQLRMTASQVLQLPFYHPTYEEGLKPALREICKAVNAPQDDMTAPGE